MGKKLNEKPTIREYLIKSVYGEKNAKLPHVQLRIEECYKTYLEDVGNALESERQQGNLLIDSPRELLDYMERRQYDYQLTMEEARGVIERAEPHPATA